MGTLCGSLALPGVAIFIYERYRKPLRGAPALLRCEEHNRYHFGATYKLYPNAIVFICNLPDTYLGIHFFVFIIAYYKSSELILKFSSPHSKFSAAIFQKYNRANPNLTL